MTDNAKSIELDEHFADYARRKVEAGEFASIDDVAQEALRRFMQTDAKLEALRAAIQEGEDSGPPQPFDFEDFLKEMRADYKGAA